ncbi:steroid 17-alpha-hydroxylase/17,20 lyase [Exaiptasia diaphana]|uniref:Steroid 21-hydroxylase n=1 Tax=Exaiptasia diaphana TaxID=2652724 RepID=A0A913X9B1_EXADI|nr:steroid 17-alpha-hydroxylase/17,20 lyase [Exaiptasia diaphana]XP_020900911.1 steroid 17-alpha-hydroxylase/17,20 lyase [Exaiptasia diaphana]
MLLESVLVVAAVSLVVVAMIRFKKPQNLPPGPKPLPLLGNLLDIAPFMPDVHLGFMKLAKKYGDIFTLHLQGDTVVVINTASIAREALLMRKDDFSGRPQSFVGDFFTRGAKDLAMGDFSPTLIYQRKLVHRALRLYMPYVEDNLTNEIHELSKRFKAANGNPIDPKNDLFLAILNVICKMVLGQSYSMDDPEFLEIVKFNKVGFRLMKPVSIYNTFPWLLSIPTQTSRDFYWVREKQAAILDTKFLQHKKTYNSEVIRDFADALLKAQEDIQGEDDIFFTDDHLIMTINDVFSAGSETVITTIRWLIACLVNFPDVQTKVQAEIDRVVGRERLPGLHDREKLHYLQAVITETHRFCTVTHLSLPHKATCDSSLNGYFIPEGTVTIFNVYAIHHDEREWDRPSEFNPNRFLDSEGKIIDVAGVKSYLPFSAGRRVCSGEVLAKKEIFLVASRLLHEFTFTNPVGSPLPDLVGEVGMNHFPKPFQVRVVERY